jgi:hypothetical protein
VRFLRSPRSEFGQGEWGESHYLLDTLYSPDIASSDFDRFGEVKLCRAAAFLADGGGLLQPVEPILTTLDAVFLEWMERPQKCIDTRREDRE